MSDAERFDRDCERAMRWIEAYFAGDRQRALQHLRDGGMKEEHMTRIIAADLQCLDAGNVHPH